jgi:hypothetical protein
MKRILTNILVFILTVITHCYGASTELPTYNIAMQLMDNGEYLAAANKFNETEDEALLSGNIELYLRSILAQGEAYYALDLSDEIKIALDHVKEAYGQYSDRLDFNQQILIQEAIAKLEGSYYYSIYDSDATAYNKAEEAYQHAKVLIDKIDNDDQELPILLMRDMMNLYYKAHKYSKALDLANEVCDFYFMMGADENATDPQSKRYYNLLVDAYCCHAMILARLNDFSGAIDDIKAIPNYLNVPSLQRILGKILMMQYDFDNTDNRARAKECYANYINYLKREINDNLTSMTDNQRERYWLKVHDFLFDCYRLGNYAPDMLYDLALFSKGYLLDFRKPNAKLYTWRNVRDKLNKDACAIEFVQYNGKDDAKQIGAIVIKHNSLRPDFIHIADLQSLEQARLSHNVTIGQAVRNDNPTLKDALYSDSTLYSMIWTPKLTKAIGDAKKVYFAPDGFLNLLAIEYMTSDNSVEYHRLSSTKTLVNPPKFDMSKMLLCGGINYTTANQTGSTYELVSANKNAQNSNDAAAYKMMASRKYYFRALPGTANEIDSINCAIRKSSSGCNVSMLRDGDATDNNFCNLATSGIPLVHLSTHGFFAGIISGSDLKPAINDNSMSESGLIMAGANSAICDSDFDSTRPDGILTAKEISQQDWNTVKLIVLSACQTGLGQMTDDGVYGLQRGLKKAGVNAMILSLWSVDDYATGELMKRFYENLVSGLPTYQAFMQARQTIISQNVTTSGKFSAATLTKKKKTNLNKSRYVNAFIMIDVL